jgi:alpha-D-ribose 1-methylphosphonate 5-triphosphate synthase subunit PhnH
MVGSKGADEQRLYSTLTFRLLLDALARPGKINQLELPQFWGDAPSYRGQADSAPTPVNLHSLGALLTLLDRETTFAMAAGGQWLDRTDVAVRWTALRSGALVADADQAAFAFFCGAGNADLLSQLSVGTLLEPELSATVFFCVEQIAPTELAESMALELRGPGIQEAQIIHVSGLQRADVEAILFARRSYPLGIDVYLIDASGRCIGLPRTTRIQLLAEAKA